MRLTELRQNEVAASVPIFVLESILGVWHPAVGDNVEYVLRSSKLAEYRQHFSFKSSEQSRRNSCDSKTGQRNGIGTMSFLALGVGRSLS